jgi:hypothetical protein
MGRDWSRCAPAVCLPSNSKIMEDSPQRAQRTRRVLRGDLLRLQRRSQTAATSFRRGVAALYERRCLSHWSPEATCLTARTALSSLRNVSSAFGEVADGEGLPTLRFGCLAALGSNCVLHPCQSFKLPAAGGGWGGIRTLGALLHTRFPSVRIRPLCHPSGMSNQ